MSYLQFCMYFQLKLSLGSFDVPSLLFLLGYPCICLITLLKFRKELKEEAYKNRISLLYNNIALYRGKWVILYYPFFIFRRLVFMLLPYIFEGYPHYQLQFLVFLSSLYLIFYTNLWPHQQRKLVYLELSNEVLLLLTSYHMITFSEFNLNLETHYVSGISLLVLIGMITFINILNVVVA